MNMLFEENENQEINFPGEQNGGGTDENSDAGEDEGDEDDTENDEPEGGDMLPGGDAAAGDIGDEEDDLGAAGDEESDQSGLTGAP